MTAPTQAGQTYGYAHRGTVTAPTELAGHYLVKVTAVNPVRPIGPYPSTVPDLEVGDRVLLTQIGATANDLVIFGKLPAEPWTSHLPIGITDVTGLQAALDDRATDTELASLETATNLNFLVVNDKNDEQDGRLDGHDTNIADLQAVDTALAATDTALAAADTALDGRLDTAEAAIATLATGLIGVAVFTASGTWTKPAGAKSVWVRVQGGGGAGGGSPANSSIARSVGGGGAGGGYCDKIFAASSLGSSEPVVVGAGGTAVSGGTGGTGGSSTFSSAGNLMTANGGTGGLASTSTGGGTGASGGTGGTASGGTVNIPGSHGLAGMAIIDEYEVSGAGGRSQLGNGGKALLAIAATVNGDTGQLYGGGGSGRAAGHGASAGPGGSGAAGVVIVYSFA